MDSPVKGKIETDDPARVKILIIESKIVDQSYKQKAKTGTLWVTKSMLSLYMCKERN